MKEKTFQRNEKKCVISVNSYHLKNYIYLTDIVIAIILNVTAEAPPPPLEKLNWPI